MKKFILPLLTCLILCGCHNTQEMSTADLKSYYRLPVKSYNVESIDQFWVVFTVEIDGKPQRILKFQSYGGQNTSAITKIN